MAVVTFMPGRFSITAATDYSRSQSLMPVPFGRPLWRRVSDMGFVSIPRIIAIMMIDESNFAKYFNLL
jgi:hypothetical protein